MAMLEEARCVCDRCGRRSEPAESRRLARDAAQAAGWQDVAGDETLCPQCRLPPFTADDLNGVHCDGCPKCEHGFAGVKWVPPRRPGEGFVRCHTEADSKLEHMCRTCNRCGYSWDEAMPTPLED